MNPIVHFEIGGSNRSELVKFYEEVFGWHIHQDESMDYGMVDTHGGKGFNGGITTAKDEHSAGVVLYAEVADINESLAKAVELGGEVLTPVTQIPDVVTFAVFKDTHGNSMGLVQGSGGPQVSDGDGVPITWFEIMGRDQSVKDFYKNLLGWEVLDMPTSPTYGTVGWEEWGFGGGLGTFEGMEEPYVTIYPEVQDVDATCAKIEELGGKIQMPPTDMTEVGIRVAAFTDPQNNMIGLYKQIGPAS